MSLRLDGIRTIGLALITGLAAGCITPEGPRGRSAATDPACLGAEAPSAATLGAALIEDPPLPGRTGSGWPAQSADDAPSDEGGSDPHGDGHHGHAH